MKCPIATAAGVGRQTSKTASMARRSALTGRDAAPNIASMARVKAQLTRLPIRYRLSNLFRVIVACVCVLTSGFAVTFGDCQCGASCCQNSANSSELRSDAVTDSNSLDQHACCDVASETSEPSKSGCCEQGNCCHGNSGSAFPGPCACDNCGCKFSIGLEAYQWAAVGPQVELEIPIASFSVPVYQFQTPRNLFRFTVQPFEPPVKLHALCGRWLV